MTHSSEYLENSIILLKLLLNYSGSMFNQFFHLLDYPAIGVKLGMLLQGLVLLVLDKSPNIIRKLIHSFLELDLSLWVLPQVREFFREFVVAVDEILDKGTQVGILLGQVEVNELGLHLGETFEYVGSLLLNVSEDCETLTVVVQLEVFPQFYFHFIIKNNLLLGAMIEACY